MKLASVSRYFDDTVASDAYAPAAKFKCQLEPFDYQKIDGASVKRRVMSTATDITIPARSVISIGGQPYLVGDGSVDHWKGAPLRKRYVLQGADYLAEIKSIAQVLTDAPGTQAYASIEFNKYTTDERDNSNFHPQYHIFFGGGEAVPSKGLIKADGRYYLVRKSHRTEAGLMDALSNEIEFPVIDSATFRSRTYDPITDTHLENPITVRCIRVRWQDHFTYLSQGSTKYEAGDMQVFVPMSVTPKAGDVITLDDGPWQVLAALRESEQFSLHVRRA